VTLWPGHGRWTARVSLLAAGALEDAALRAQVEAHVDRCPACADALRAERAVVAALRSDAARIAEPPLAHGALRTRVFACLDEAARAPRNRARGGAAWALGTAGAVLLAAAGTFLLRDTVPPSLAPAAPPVEMTQAREDFVRRLERNVAREQAARYLDEAGDVLVTVAGHSHPCAQGGERVDMAEEAQRSRELLARRRLLDVDGAAVATARPVLDDVEQVLREVASLESCARKRDLDTIHRQLERSRLLLKIDLTARELQG
jgi:hypothetical protein